MDVPKKLMIGMVLVTGCIVGYTGIEINGALDHMREQKWNDVHAYFHAVSGLLWLETMFIVCTYILWRFVKQGENWAWWIVTFIGIGVFGGAVASDPLSGGGLKQGETALATGMIAYWSGWATLAIWLFGMWLARPYMKKA